MTKDEALRLSLRAHERSQAFFLLRLGKVFPLENWISVRIASIFLLETWLVSAAASSQPYPVAAW